MDFHTKLFLRRVPTLHCTVPIRETWSRAVWMAILIVLGSMFMDRAAWGQDPNWVWSHEHEKDAVPLGKCHFRKAFNMRAPELGRIAIWCDDSYTLYVNGRRVAEGASWEKPDEHDISRHLMRGRNLVAIEVVNANGNSAGFAARLTVKEEGHTVVSLSTDASWKASLRVLPFWQMSTYSDRRWPQAQVYGLVGETAPWVQQIAEKTRTNSRFKVSREFEIRELLNNEMTQSVIAMAFDEFDRIVFARENSGIYLAVDNNDDGLHDSVREYSDQVKNCQGILPLNGNLFVLGDGPDGTALYRLSDADRNGDLEHSQTLVKFECKSKEHGPHGLVLGPDGLVYIVLGNHTVPVEPYDAKSPYRNHYEGFLAHPKYEDPGGHATGIKAPGGAVIRTDLQGSKVEIVAGGLRNAYDLAFSREGELFTHDSDMEFDQGMPWQRTTRLLHVTPGAEYGWRSGWSKWPDYLIDTVPPVSLTGRGSPTGVVFYDHVAFPSRYHNALFSCDWSTGMIIAYKLERNGASYRAKGETFLEGEPLNVTDIDVGPDGALYFSTGGRGTHGGIYRVAWRGAVPEEVTDVGSGITAVFRQPQLQSSWGRQKTALAKAEIGSSWSKQLSNVIENPQSPPHYSFRALHALRLFGPSPSTTLLTGMAKRDQPDICAAAAYFMGTRPKPDYAQSLVSMLRHDDARVRRRACEALLRMEEHPTIQQLSASLSSTDRFEACAARRLLERIPSQPWRKQILTTKDHRLFIQGALALMVAEPSRENGLAVTQRFVKLFEEYINDRDFTDMLRVQQVALLRGKILPSEVPELGVLLANEFPCGETTMNRELVRLLSYLQVHSCMDRYIDYLASDVDETEKLHLAVHLRYLRTGWTSDAKIAYLQYFDRALRNTGGNNYPHYIQNISQDFAPMLTDSERRQILAGGAEWPNSSYVALVGVADNVTPDLLDLVRQLDGAIRQQNTSVAKRLKTAILAVLSTAGDEKSLAYLRDIYEREPERRILVAIGLSEHPTVQNWPYLVRSLNISEGEIAAETMQTLTQIKRIADQPEQLRQVILQGQKQNESGQRQAIALLQHWTGESVSDPSDDPQQAIERWQDWFSKKYPDQNTARLPQPTDESKWTLDELAAAIDNHQNFVPSVEHGLEVFSKAKCAACHRFGDVGESMGPDLSSISRRFHKKEILESILYPSHVISDQYTSKTVVTDRGRTYTGIVAPGSTGETIVLQSNGERVTVRDDEVDEIVPTKMSSMPEGLLDTLTLQEVVDLFAYLGQQPRSTVSTRRGKNLR